MVTTEENIKTYQWWSCQICVAKFKTPKLWTTAAYRPWASEYG
jgi:hypothetical protein